MPPDQFWYCGLITLFVFYGSMCSTMFILSMTFDRLYSIIAPHKAAAVNTVTRAQFTIILVIILTFLWTLPQLFLTDNIEKDCIPYAKATSTVSQLYIWCYTAFIFPIPFVLVLTMNSIIIHILRKRSRSLFKRSEGNQGQGQNDDQISKMKSSNRQTFTMLLLVAFAYLFCSMPLFIFGYVRLSVDFNQTAEDMALAYLLNSVGEKLYYTNFGINFYLYVISGRKFRSDLGKMFADFSGRMGCKKDSSESLSRGVASIATASTSIEH